jgi:hypothetical protein
MTARSSHAKIDKKSSNTATIPEMLQVAQKMAKNIYIRDKMSIMTQNDQKKQLNPTKPIFTFNSCFGLFSAIGPTVSLS